VINDRFEWDEEKAASNLKKHGVSFDVAALAFDDRLSVTISDPENSEGELRLLLIGMTRTRALLVVAHVEREDRIRIISARRATAKERRRYMNRDFDEIRDEMLPEYDFSGGVRGKYYRGTTVMVRLENDVAAIFPTSKEVNEALRQLIAEGRVPQTTSTD
jgi:uncharacterized DUF497 family protein